VARGSFWTSLSGGEPSRLNEGDMVLFPQGDHHVMSSAPGLRAKAVDPAVFFTSKPSQLPFSFPVTAQGLPNQCALDDGSEQTTVVCGFLGCDAKPANPLLASMP